MHEQKENFQHQTKKSLHQHHHHLHKKCNKTHENVCKSQTKIRSTIVNVLHIQMHPTHSHILTYIHTYAPHTHTQILRHKRPPLLFQKLFNQEKKKTH